MPFSKKIKKMEKAEISNISKLVIYMKRVLRLQTGGTTPLVANKTLV